MSKTSILNVIRMAQPPLDIPKLEILARRDGSTSFIEGHPELTQSEKQELHSKNLVRLSPIAQFERDERDQLVKERRLKQDIASVGGAIPRVAVSDVMRHNFWDLYSLGYSTQAISDAYEGTVSKSTVQKYLSEDNKTIPKNIEKRGQVIELLCDIRELNVRRWRSTGERISFENNNKNTKTDEDTIELMRCLYHQKLPMAEIAKLAKVPRSTVNNYIDRYFK